MRFVVQVNVNPSHDYASIHTTKCSFAKEPPHETENTYWKGPFDTYEEALGVAERLSNDVRNCFFCRPHSRS